MAALPRRAAALAALLGFAWRPAGAFMTPRRARLSIARDVIAPDPTSSPTEDWAAEYGGGAIATGGAPFHRFFKSLADHGIGVGGEPLVYRRSELKLKHQVNFANYFTMEDLRVALAEDFLDAGRGTTQMRGGWKMAPVSTPRGASFLEARMSYEEVQTALEQGTVVFNSAGAHIPSLCAVSLAALDAIGFPTCLNLYITAPGKKTSAPPHTDKQDVFVLQSTGTKRWRVYNMPEPARDPQADPYTRGKGDDTLHLSELSDPVLDVTLTPGDVLFIPAGCPHTTDTLSPAEAGDAPPETSLHLTVGIDTYIWGLHLAFLRGLTYLRAGAPDALGGLPNLYKGVVNTLPTEIRSSLGRSLPAGFLRASLESCDTLGGELQRWAAATAVATKAEDAFAQIPPGEWVSTVQRAQTHNRDLHGAFRALYTDGIAEGERRRANPDALVEPAQLSVFRVKPHFERLESIMDHFISHGSQSPHRAPEQAASEESWIASTDQPPSRGEEVRVDLGGAWFMAKVVTARSDGDFDVEFFDGELEGGVSPARMQVRPRAPATAEKQAEKKAKTAQLRKKQRKRRR